MFLCDGFGVRSSFAPTRINTVRHTGRRGSVIGVDETAIGAGRQARVRPQAGVGAQVGRTLWGLFFIGGATFNALFTLPQPEVYRAFSQLTFFGWYRELLLAVALPNATALTSLVVLLELTAGLLMLSRGTAVRVGLIGSAAWVVFLCPSMGWYSVWIPLLAVIPLVLMRFDYERDVVRLVVRGLRGQRAGA